MWARFNQAQSQFTVDSGRAGDQHGTEGVGQNAPTKLFDSFVSPLQFVLLNTCRGSVASGLQNFHVLSRTGRFGIGESMQAKTLRCTLFVL